VINRRVNFGVPFSLLSACLLLQPIIDVSAAQTPTNSGNGIWKTVEQVPLSKSSQAAWIRPAAARVVEMDISAWTNSLKSVPMENILSISAPGEIVELPMPDGSFALFQIVESPVMAPELAAKFPEIKTYAGVGLDDPGATVRLDWTPRGFHAQILSARGAVYIDPYSKDDRSLYSVYYKRDFESDAEFQCLTESRDPSLNALPLDVSILRSGPTLRTYRLACAATVEYTAFHGGTVLLGQAAIVTAINRVTGIYEVEVGVRLVLVANNDLLVYTTTDPYSNNSGSLMLGQNQLNVNNIIGSANYDIGHVFSTGGGGIAGLGVVCDSSQKARGVTGQSSPIGDPFYIDFVAHEMGHQFNGDHTFNSETGSCGSGNINNATAYEPGSGSTIMAYAGLCGADNLQGASDPYFHSISFDQIIAYIVSAGCGAQSGTGNTAPTVNAGPNYVIPANTPFILTATGSDVDGDPLTFCWEERDLGPSTTLAANDNGSSPLFRSFNPTTNTWRTFPRLPNILNGSSSLGEKLPTTSRAMNFRVTARDNQPGGGGVNTDDMLVSVSSVAGPFIVTAPNSAVIWSGQQTVAWNVAGTTNAPVNAASVDIYLSSDGGFTFPYTLASGTPNDGLEMIVLPAITTTNARIKIQGTSNIFFDVSNVSFGVIPGIPIANVVVDSITFTNETCLDFNGAVDPGETITAKIALRNTGTLNASNVMAGVISTTNVTSYTGLQLYGDLPAGGSATTQSFLMVANGNCGDSIRLLVQAAIGTNQLGIITNNIFLGGLISAVITNSNTSAIAVPASGTTGNAGPYPTTINISGLAGVVSKVTVSVSGMTHTYPDDIDVLLRGPGGQSVLLMSDAGGGGNISNVRLVFDDAAATQLPDASTLSSGTNKPTDYTAGDTFGSPAPAGPYGTSLAAFIGSNPNGDWSLFVIDDASGDQGDFTGGWSLTIDSFVTVCCTQLLTVSNADLSVVQYDAPDTVISNSLLRYDIVISNAGPDAAFGVTVTNVPSIGVGFVAALSNPDWMETNGLFAINIDELASGIATTLVLYVEVNSNVVGAITNIVTIHSDTQDSNTVNNVSAEVTQVQDLDGDMQPDFADEDDDGDLIPDEYELANGLNATDPADAADDDDNDTQNNLSEYIADSNPGDSNSFHRILDVSYPNPAMVIFPSSTGRVYYLEYNTNLLLPTWQLIGSNVPGVGGVMTLPGTNDSESLQFRVGVELP